MADNIRGDGLIRLERALAVLAEDQQLLDRARMRFSDSPPSYRSHQSHNSTLSQSPNQPSEEQQRRDERRWQVKREQDKSRPYYQLMDQEIEEERRIIEEHENGTRRVPVGTSFEGLAHENVKKRWEEQGIWNHKWNELASAVGWKHEEPLEPESDADMDIDTEAASQAAIFSFFGGNELKSKAQPKAQPPRSDEEGRIAERRAARERERDASRPFFQFIHQVSKERDRIQEVSRVRDASCAGPADINTEAYGIVRNIWMKRSIWNKKWGILPGMSWKHEEPLGELLEEDSAGSPAPAQAPPLGSGRHDTALPACIFGPSPSADTHQRQDSDIMGTSLNRQATNIEEAGLMNVDIESHSPPLQQRRQTLRSRARQTAQPKRRKPIQNDAIIESVASTSLGPVHPSKVSKATTKKRPRLRKSNAAEDAASGGPPLVPQPKTLRRLPEAASITPRRSKRLQSLKSGRTAQPSL